MLQCVAVCHSVLQRVAVCRSVSQCVAVNKIELQGKCCTICVRAQLNQSIYMYKAMERSSYIRTYTHTYMHARIGNEVSASLKTCIPSFR